LILFIYLFIKIIKDSRYSFIYVVVRDLMLWVFEDGGSTSVLGLMKPEGEEKKKSIGRGSALITHGS
jgi:hypothetical protein